ncbi:AMP-binding protein [Roseomonas sp. NAR14]|uniref:acetate--CoA ligase n=1 Tax=Roseomonas acroporae TaxID=2937791 RepID=A0A9X1YG32_9PROT|nr:AMP-binding protein [Roseomonas acroporae]MCK8788042.1 AMP-binding protein [Roseomonas acroporae]
MEKLAPHEAPLWRPTPRDRSDSQLARLVAYQGLDSYDALLEQADRQPDRYWRGALEFLGIRWRRDYATFLDLSDGAPFPRWFTGGTLNWLDTIFAHDAARMAVIAEDEAGGTRHVSYGGLREAVGRFAGGLARQGIGRGDRVGLLMESGIEAVVSLLALSWLGAVAVPLFSGFGVDAIVSRLSASGARALVATTGFDRRGRRIDTRPLLREARAQLPDLGLLVLKGPPDEVAAVPEALAWTALAAAEAAGAEPATMAPDEPMMVIYTSGTTGRPKGAVHAHGGFPLKIAHDAAVHFDIGAGDVFFWPADMGWVAGPLTIASALMRGATMVCYDGAPDFPDWSRLSRLVSAHGVTHLGASPTLIRGLAANEALATAGALDTVRLLITAGEVISPEHMGWYQRVMGRGTCPVINYSGGTEVSGALVGNVLLRPIVPAGFNSISPGVRVEVVDEAGQPVRDRVGELAILQPFVGMTQSFWQDRERYLETYWSQVPGIWMHGDLAMRTGDGQIFLLGRSDDTLKVAGKRLGPAEVEDILLELPEIGEAAAIGVEDAVKGQKLVVFLVPAAGRRPDPSLSTPLATPLAARAAALVESRMGRPFRPARVHVVEDLPRTRSQKVMRRVIRRVYTGQNPGDLGSLDNPASLARIGEAAREAG